ncbi:MAG TPA: nuclear transport factor 2 family protein [Candidatus Binatia bacterium]|nr:nuclear transport factor 2 family protein [Candidatus Binatia bacterium]
MSEEAKSIMAHGTVSKWHAMLEAKEIARLDDLLADDVVFHSPVVHTPQRGKAITTIYLTAAYQVLFGSGFRYVREVAGDSDAILEFVAEIDGIHVNGVDMMHWNAEGKIDDFKVMVRPLKAVNLLHGLMARMLEQLGPKQ